MNSAPRWRCKRKHTPRHTMKCVMFTGRGDQPQQCPPGCLDAATRHPSSYARYVAGAAPPVNPGQRHTSHAELPVPSSQPMWCMPPLCHWVKDASVVPLWHMADMLDPRTLEAHMCEGFATQSFHAGLWSLRRICVRWWQPQALNTQVSPLRFRSPNPLVTAIVACLRLQAALSPMPSAL